MKGVMSVYGKDVAKEELLGGCEWSSSRTLMESWLKKCSARAHEHSRESLRSGFANRMLSVPKLFFGGAATALSFWATSDLNGSSHRVRVLVAVLSAISTVLASLSQFLRYDESQYRHQMAAGMYTQLCRRIELSFFSEDEGGVNDAVLAEIAAGFSNVATFSPQINI
ncbi:unknown [Feldmannia species virus]|uniref:Uncharacterized protein n=1 Tax=Feldmannia species virus TaxID=39420 RepID=B5LWK1_9PHYC|nr:hypothetical protein FeldSpV_gp112 [Feldmannia species virus]ACH46864.1 unknown [Feldmannia species virus]